MHVSAMLDLAIAPLCEARDSWCGRCRVLVIENAVSKKEGRERVLAVVLMDRVRGVFWRGPSVLRGGWEVLRLSTRCSGRRIEPPW